MVRQFLVGGSVSIINIAIHSLVMAAVVRVAQLAGARDRSHPSLRLVAVMIPIVSLLMATHALEVMVWAIAYAAVNVAPDEASLVYFAFVNYTTLGYGDIVPLERWQLLGPITAMNGVLLFGWSTAVIFEVLRRTRERGAISAAPRSQKRIARRAIGTAEDLGTAVTAPRSVTGKRKSSGAIRWDNFT